MNDNTLQALTVLANKLGTTADKLWHVLLTQAHIVAITDGIIALLTLLATVFWTCVVAKKTKKVTIKEESSHRSHFYTYEKAEWGDDGAMFAWISVVAAWILALVFIVTTVYTVVTVTTNPDYWALKQILDSVK